MLSVRLGLIHQVHDKKAKWHQFLCSTRADPPGHRVGVGASQTGVLLFFFGKKCHSNLDRQGQGVSGSAHTISWFLSAVISIFFLHLRFVGHNLPGHMTRLRKN